MWTLSEPAEELISQQDAAPRQATDRYWQMAGDRVLLYLRSLHVPTPQAIEIAFAALEAARSNISRGSGNSPPAEAMQELMKRLNGQYGSCAPAISQVGRCESSIAPPLRRLPMIPEKMSSAPWRGFLKNLSNRFR